MTANYWPGSIIQQFSRILLSGIILTTLLSILPFLGHIRDNDIQSVKYFREKIQLQYNELIVKQVKYSFVSTFFCLFFGSHETRICPDHISSQNPKVMNIWV